MINSRTNYQQNFKIDFIFYNDQTFCIENINRNLTQLKFWHNYEVLRVQELDIQYGEIEEKESLIPDSGKYLNECDNF